VCLFCHVRGSLLSHVQVSFLVAQDLINVLRLRSWAVSASNRVCVRGILPFVHLSEVSFVKYACLFYRRTRFDKYLAPQIMGINASNGVYMRLFRHTCRSHLMYI